MKIVDHKQTWEGFFTYPSDDDYSDQDLEVTFKMELIFNENSFTGTSRDSESEHIFEEPTIVKGFIEDNKISFILNYPCYYYRDEDGNIQIDKDLPHPIVEYLGYYDEYEKKFSGTWEIIIHEEKISEDNFLEEFIYGDFEMQRIK